MESCCGYSVPTGELLDQWSHLLRSVQYKLLDKSHLPFAPPEHPRKATTSTDALELMLQEVIGITPSAASGIAAVHPTFADLMEAFEYAEGRGGVARAEAMLADCDVCRNVLIQAIG